MAFAQTVCPASSRLRPKRWPASCLKRAGIPKETAAGIIDGHALRHSYGTILSSSGADIETVRSLMRHKCIKTTQRYLHTDDEKRRAAVEGMPKFLPTNGGAA